MLKEISSITPPADSFWRTIMATLGEHPNCVVPVILRMPDMQRPVGEFHASIAKEGERVYLQVENVTDELSYYFFGEKGFEDGWQVIPDGLYRLPITSPLLGP